MEATVLEHDELYHNITDRLQNGGPEFSHTDRLVIRSRIQKLSDLLSSSVTEEDKQRLAGALEMYKAAIAPIRRIPEQLLCCIFELTVDAEDSYLRVSNVERPPWSLTHVCRFWRQIAVADVKLWSHVNIELRGEYYPTRWLLREWLSRSKNQSLDVTLNWVSSWEECVGSEMLDTDVVETLMESSARWRSFKLEWNGDYEEEERLEWRQEIHLEQLADDPYADVSDGDSPDSWRPPPVRIFRKLKNRVPLLESLDISSVSDFAEEFRDAFVSAPLRSVHVKNCNHLDEARLDWSNVTRFSYDSSWQDVTGITYDILKKAPNLEEVLQASSRRGSYPPSSPEARIRISTTRLQKLSIVDENILEHITAPNLWYLGLRILPRLGPLLPSFLQRSNCRITSLDLFINEHNEAAQVVGILEAIPTVTRLYLQFVESTATTQVMSRLAGKENQLVPNLHFLQLSTEDRLFSWSMILDLVESRFKQTQCQFELRFDVELEEAVLTSLRELRREGLKIQLIWARIQCTELLLD